MRTENVLPEGGICKSVAAVLFGGTYLEYFVANNNNTVGVGARHGVPNRIFNFFIWLNDKVYSILCLLLGSVLFLGVVLTVILRYFFGVTFVTSEAAITFIFIATTYLGIALGIREKDHIDIPFLYEKMGPRTQLFLDILINLIIIAIMVIMYKYSLKWIKVVGNTANPSLHIKMKYFYYMVPVSSIISIFYCFVDILSKFIYIADPDCGYDKAEYDEEACKEAEAAIARDFRTERLIIKGSKKEREGK